MPKRHATASLPMRSRSSKYGVTYRYGHHTENETKPRRSPNRNAVERVLPTQRATRRSTHSGAVSGSAGHLPPRRNRLAFGPFYQGGHGDPSASRPATTSHRVFDLPYADSSLAPRAGEHPLHARQTRVLVEA